ncbi:MAG: spore coat U domain-containing protein [Pseudomonadota bacterium]
MQVNLLLGFDTFASACRNFVHDHDFSQTTKECWKTLIFIAVLFSSDVYAACVITGPSTTSFGNVSSLDVAAVVKNTSAPDAGLECGPPTILGLLGADIAEATVLSTNNAGLVNASGDRIPYQIFADSPLTQAITPGVAYDYYNSYILSLLGIITVGSTNKKMPMYFRTVPTGLNVSAGLYTDTLTINWNWSVCIVRVLSACVGKSEGTNSVTMTLNLTITNDCLITAPAVNFGSSPLVSGFPALTQTITIRCTRNSAFNVGLDNGSNFLTTQRRMKSGSNFLNYELYKGSAVGSRWGMNGLERRSSGDAEINPGIYDGVTGLGFRYHAVIPAQQTTPPAGAYTDTIILDVQF